MPSYSTRPLGATVSTEAAIRSWVENPSQATPGRRESLYESKGYGFWKLVIFEPVPAGFWQPRREPKQPFAEIIAADEAGTWLRKHGHLAPDEKLTRTTQEDPVNAQRLAPETPRPEVRRKAGPIFVSKNEETDRELALIPTADGLAVAIADPGRGRKVIFTIRLDRFEELVQAIVRECGPSEEC